MICGPRAGGKLVTLEARNGERRRQKELKGTKWNEIEIREHNVKIERRKTKKELKNKGKITKHSKKGSEEN
jgi:hypothetical protein